MAQHEYTPDDALQLLLGKLRQYPDLHAQVREAIDAGKEDIDTKAPSRQRLARRAMGRTEIEDSGLRFEPQRDKPHEYRKLAPFSAEEALDVAARTLQAYFVEQALFVNAIVDNLEVAGGIEIDIRTDTQSINETSRTDTAFKLNRSSENELRTQKGNIDRLRQLLDFSGE